MFCFILFRCGCTQTFATNSWEKLSMSVALPSKRVIENSRNQQISVENLKKNKKRISCNWMQRFIIVGAVIAIAIVKIVWLKPTNEENKIKDRQTNRQTDIKDRRFLDICASSADISAQLRLTSYAVVCKITRII